MTAEGFNPHILGFFCNWCCYAAADSAGVGRYQYPPNVRVIRVMCTGRLDMRFILEAFKSGADGVFAGGCHLNECHYQSGNYEAMIMAETCWQVLEDCGAKRDRFALKWASAAEGPLYVEIITKYINKIKSMGRVGSFEGELSNGRFKRHIEAACLSAANAKVRTAFGNLAKKMRQLNDFSIYTEDKIRDEVREKVFPVFRAERIAQETLLILRSMEKITIDDLCSKTGGSLEEMEKIIASLSKKGVVQKDGHTLLMVKSEKGADNDS